MADRTMDLNAALEGEPSAGTVLEVLEELKSSSLNAPTAGLLAAFSTLVNKTIYDFVDIDFVPAFLNITGIGCIISQLAMLVRTQPQSPKISVLVTLLENTLLRDPTLIRRVAEAQPMEAQNLFVGSRLFAVTSTLKYKTWVADGKEYSNWVAEQLLAFDEIPPSLLDKLFKLGYAKPAFCKILATDHTKFADAFSALRPSQQQYCLSHGALPALENVSVEAAGAILKFLDPKVNLVSLAEQYSLNIQLAVVSISDNFTADSLKLLAMWGDTSTIQTTSMAYQTAQTQMLISFACHMSAQQAKEVTKSMQFLTAISNRLEALSERARLMGTLVADMFSDKAGEKLRFGLDGGEWNFSVYTAGSLASALLELKEPKRHDYELTSAPLAPAPGSDDEDDEAAVGDSDDEEDEKTVAPPVYVKTLLEYLSSDSYEQHYSALHHGRSLIYRKAEFGSEVSQYAPELLVLLAGLGDKFNIRNFAELRQGIMTAIVVVDPTRAEIVANLALTGDLSLFQRMSLMSTLVLAAQELASYKGTQEPVSKLLPTSQHNSFVSDVDLLVNSVQNTLVVDTRDKLTEELSEELGGPKVLRVSKRLQKQGEPAKPTGVNKFAKVAARYFFFPLAVHRPRRAGAYTPMLHAHIIKTLGLLVYYAYPSNDMPDMVAEMLDILLVQTETDVVIIEAIYTALLVLCDVAGGILVSRYPQKLAGLYDWARQSWQTVPDDKVQKLGAGVVLRLGELVDQISKLLET